MKTILTDLGTEYVNSVVTNLCDLMKIEHRKSTAYHHQMVGTAERSHRTFNEYVRSYISSNLDQWEEYTRYFSFCYNITPHSAYKNRYSPYELIL